VNQITRDVYVLSNKVKEPIDYVRFTNALPVIFNFRDYDIPPGATATVFCAKPSGKAVYTDATISGNTITIDVSNQMFIELGRTVIQVKIENGSSTLVTFGWPVDVHENSTEGDVPPSQNESGFWDELQQQVDEAVENANNAADSVDQAIQETQQATQNANNAAESANQAAQEASEAASNINEDAIKNAIGSYFNDNPIEIDDPYLDVDTLRFAYITVPELENSTLSFPIGSDPSAVLANDVQDLKDFANQFEGKTLYTT